jgi:16S rRNA (guanine527-N7)-methyltransferase
MLEGADMRLPTTHLDRLFGSLGSLASPLARSPGASPAGAHVGALVVPENRAHLEKWLELLVEWNARMDLTAARDEAELCDLMLADALVLAGCVPHGATVLDVGSGAGAPGLPLALARPDLRVTLVEPLAKRVAFLRTVIGTVGRADIRLERGRGEQAVPPKGGFDVAMSRATLAPPAWLALGATKIAPHGSVWVLLAKEEPPSHAGMIAVEEIEYVWPCTSAQRRAVRFSFA